MCGATCPGYCVRKSWHHRLSDSVGLSTHIESLRIKAVHSGSCTQMHRRHHLSHGEHCLFAGRNVDALRASAMSWLPVLCAAFVAAAPEARGPLGDAIAAYACICAPDVVAGFFRTAMQKLIKVMPAHCLSYFCI